MANPGVLPADLKRYKSLSLIRTCRVAGLMFGVNRASRFVADCDQLGPFLSHPAAGGEAAGRVAGVSHLPGRTRQKRPPQFHLQAGE